MEESIRDISDFCYQNGIPVDPEVDPAHTGLIGPELTEITTTIGYLEAKRSTINPNFASLIVYWLEKAGVQSGDTIALSCSGSFPALLIASLSAAKAMDLKTITILSLGASSFGATHPKFTLLDIYEVLQSSGLVNSPPQAITLGGTDDVGKEFPDSIKSAIVEKINAKEIPLIFDDDLQSNISKRMSIYFPTPETGIKVLINTGGAEASMGTSPDILLLKPGLTHRAELPAENTRGTIYEMLAREVPVIHLLFIRGIVQEYNLIWDPVSVPTVNMKFISRMEEGKVVRGITGMGYLIYFLFLLIRFNKLYNMK
jgi:poly-gamma-glutamate system protein